MYLDASTRLLNKVCQIAASSLRTSIACILACEPTGAKRIRGSTGCLISNLKGNIAIAGLEITERDTMYLAGLAKQKWFAHHPLKTLAPAAKSLLVTSLGDGNHYLAVFNPDDAVLKRPDTISLLSDLLALAAIQLAGESTVGIAPSGPASLNEGVDERVTGFNEAPLPSNHVDEMARFLDKTLLRRRNLGVRSNVAFVTVRSWRGKTKDVQIAAMCAVKRNPSPYALDLIASEIAGIAKDLNGSAAYDAVVPVPCGSSGTEQCLSAILASEVARQLNIPVARCLKGKLGKGSSHPKKNMALGPYLVAEPVPKRVLLIDDVVTSGRHMEVSAIALRDAGANVTAIGWIGPAKSDA